MIQLIHRFEESNDNKVSYEIVDRRPGDIAECNAEYELGWKAKKDLIHKCRGS